MRRKVSKIAFLPNKIILLSQSKFCIFQPCVIIQSFKRLKWGFWAIAKEVFWNKSEIKKELKESIANHKRNENRHRHARKS